MTDHIAFTEELTRLVDTAAEAVRAINHKTLTGPTLPAPWVYDIAGSLKLVGYGLAQANHQLAARLATSAEEFEFYECDGRDPGDSISAAMTGFRHAAEHAQAIAILLDGVQSCLAGQGVRS